MANYSVYLCPACGKEFIPLDNESVDTYLYCPYRWSFECQKAQCRPTGNIIVRLETPGV